MVEIFEFLMNGAIASMLRRLPSQADAQQPLEVRTYQQASPPLPLVGRNVKDAKRRGRGLRFILFIVRH